MVTHVSGGDAGGMCQVLTGPNLRLPMKFENDLFVGRALCILRSPTVPLDPFYASHFDGRERMFDFQVRHQLSSSTY